MKKYANPYVLLIVLVMAFSILLAAFDARGIPIVLGGLVVSAIIWLLHSINQNLIRLNQLLLGNLKKQASLRGPAEARTTVEVDTSREVTGDGRQPRVALQEG